MKSTNFFNRVLAVLVLCICFLMASCGVEIEHVHVSFLTLSDTEVELEAGDIHVLECTVSPYNADNQRIIWSSSDKSVATVKDGVVTAVKAGNAIITAMSDDNGKTATCVVKVTDKGGNNGGGEPGIDMASAVNLSSAGTANCYIVSETGLYKFKAVKGNSDTSVGAVSSVEVLWESFGTSVAPESGELVSAVYFQDSYIAFQCHKIFYEGNAVVAAKDAAGNILWSWHLWFTDAPQSQTYYNNAGIVMDRNLGATSATPGEVGAIGLLYQWGRKDPFLGSSSISTASKAASTLEWPSAVSSNSEYGTIDYATAHPTTFISRNFSNYDWYYTGSKSTDNTRWTTSDKAKSIYDPCPAGWRVPDGGSNGIWSKAAGADTFNWEFDDSNLGMDFLGKLGTLSIWYPASGHIYGGALEGVGQHGVYWSSNDPSRQDEYEAPSFVFAPGSSLKFGGTNHHFTDGTPTDAYLCRSLGFSVRCSRE